MPRRWPGPRASRCWRGATPCSGRSAAHRSPAPFSCCGAADAHPGGFRPPRPARRVGPPSRRALLGAHADYRRLQQVPGIGPINALTILAEAGDLRRFGHHRQFLKFCGLDLATHQSGQFRGRTKLSKRGNARLRRALWMAAQVAVRQRENGFRAKFERYVARDRHDPDLRRKALTAVAAKMARVVHALIKGGADYRPFVEGPVPGGGTPLCRSRGGAPATP
jgi:hypothetical protein